MQLLNNREEYISVHLKSWNYDGSVATATLFDPKDKNSFLVNYPLPVIKEKESFNSCKVFLLKNRFGSKEDQCFNLEIDKIPSGIIYPISVYSDYSSLPNPGFSKETDFLYRFLYIGFYNLLDCKHLPTPELESDILFEPNIKVEDFYTDDTVILLYHNTSVANLELSKYLPALFKLGYVPINNANDFKEVEIIKRPQRKHPLFSKSVLDVISISTNKSTLTQEKFVSQVFGDILKTSLPTLSRFILLYQVIELLIDKIALEHYRSKRPFTAEMATLQIAADRATSYRDVFDNLHEILKRINNSNSIKEEARRIEMLISHKCKLDIIDYPDFVVEAKKLIGTRKCSTLKDYIYQLRNKIIHDYHTLSATYPNLDTLLSGLNLEFELIIADIIIEYDPVA